MVAPGDGHRIASGDGLERISLPVRDVRLALILGSLPHLLQTVARVWLLVRSAIGGSRNLRQEAGGKVQIC